MPWLQTMSGFDAETGLRRKLEIAMAGVGMIDVECDDSGKISKAGAKPEPMNIMNLP